MSTRRPHCRRPHRRAGLAALAALALTAGWAQADDTLLARNLAATCANCHGSNGNAVGESRPLAGVPAEKIVATVADFKSGARPATVMHQIAKGYSDAQIRLIAGYLASQTPKK